MAKLMPAVSCLGKVLLLGAGGAEPELLAIQRTFRPRRQSAPVEVRFPTDWMQADNPDQSFRMQVQGWTMFHPIMDVFDEFHDKTSAVEYFFDVLDERAVHGQDFDDPTMQVFVSEHDDDVQPGWAVGFSRPPGTSFRGLAALTLSREGLQHAEDFARTLEFDPSLALAVFDGAPAASRDIEESPPARRPGVGGWFDALQRR